MSIDIVLIVPTPAPARAPLIPFPLELAAATAPAKARASIFAVDTAVRDRGPCDTIVELSINAATVCPRCVPISLSDTDTPTPPAPAFPLPSPTAMARPPLSARMLESSLAAIVIPPSVADKPFAPLLSLTDAIIELSIRLRAPEPAPAKAPARPCAADFAPDPVTPKARASIR